MFGSWELWIIILVALIILGPKKIPELARGLGKGIREFRRATEDIRDTIEGDPQRPSLPGPQADYTAVPVARAEPVAKAEEAPADDERGDTQPKA